MSKMNLCGVAYIRAINSPDNFKSLAAEAKQVFNTPEGNKYMFDILTKKDPNKFVDPPQGFTEDMNAYAKKALLHLGKLTFIDCKVDFELKENHTLVHDIVTEITIKDGIVTKIEKPNLKYAYGI